MQVVGGASVADSDGAWRVPCPSMTTTAVMETDMDDRLPTPILRAFPYAAGTALLAALLLALFAPRALLAQRGDRVPPGHRPPDGMCRVWYDRVPPGRQPAPTDCATARAEAWRSGGRVITGGRDGRRRDDGWWGGETGRIEPWGDRARRRDGDWRDDDDDRRERRRDRDDVRWDDRRRDDGDRRRERIGTGSWEQRREDARRRKERAAQGDASGPWKRDRVDTSPRF